MSPASDAAAPPEVAVVGSLVPDDARFRGPAFSLAGQMFQRELLRALEATGAVRLSAFTMVPHATYPAEPVLLERPRRLDAGGGVFVSSLPYLNLPLVKKPTLGVSTLVALLRWRLRTPGRSRVVFPVNLIAPSAPFLALGARLAGARLVPLLLDVFEPGQLVPDTLGWRWSFRLHRWLLPRVDGLVVVSEAAARDLAPGVPSLHLEGGVSAEVLAATAGGPRERRPGDAFVAVFAGSLIEANGVRLVLDAFARLPDGAFRLRVAGDGPLAALVRERANADPRIEALGPLPFGDVLRLYREGDLVLNARVTRTLKTGYFFPSKLMEALASGTPVLSTTTGHVERDFGDLLFLLRDETPEGLAARLVEIAALDAGERTALAGRARAFMETRRTWALQATRLARFLVERAA